MALHDGRVEGVGRLGRGLNDLQQAAFDFTNPSVPARARLLPRVDTEGLEQHLLLFEIRPGSGVVYANVED